MPLLVVAGAFAFGSGFVATGPQPTLGMGAITPDHVVHEFGTAKIHGGYLTTSIPLAVDGSVSAIDLTTS